MTPILALLFLQLHSSGAATTELVTFKVYPKGKITIDAVKNLPPSMFMFTPDDHSLWVLQIHNFSFELAVIGII